MNRDHEPFGEWQFTGRILRGHQWDVLAAHALTHRACLVETKQLASIVDEQVEMCEKIFTENPADARIGCLNLPKVLDHDKWLFDHVGDCFQPIQNGYRSVRVAGNGNEADRALRLEVEFGG